MNIKLASRSCTDDEGRERTFHYSLIIDLIRTDHFCMENYGVSIEEENGAAASFAALTANPSKIDELMTLLVDHTVGPAGLPDVIADWRRLTAPDPPRCSDPASASA